MPRSAKQVLEEALRLPDDARAELVCDLLDSFGAPPARVEPTDEKWLREIERRGRAALAGEPGIPWQEVRSAIQRRLAGG